MTRKHWTLVDADRGSHREGLRLDSTVTAGLPKGICVSAQPLHGGLSDGIDVVEINNGACRFAILPMRGMSIHRAWLGDFEVGWKSPVRGPVHPKFVPLWAPHGIGWLDGFDELFVRCGLESNGPPVFDEASRLKHPLHGRIANQPAHRVELSIDTEAGEIAVTGEVDEARLFHNKLRMTTTIITRFNEPGFRVRDEITNLSREPGELQLLYHINFGQPLLEPGAKVVLPVQTLVPQTENAARGLSRWDTYFEPEPGFAEHVFHMELAAGSDGHTQALLHNAAANRGVSLHFSKRQLPLFTLWKSMQPPEDGYVTGLEPAINYPNPRAFEKENGRVARLASGESRVFEIGLQIHGDKSAVSAAAAEVASLQRSVEPKIYQQPTRPWAMAGK